MLGLTNLEVYFAVFNITKENEKFEIAEPVEEREESNSLEESKFNDKVVGPENPKVKL